MDEASNETDTIGRLEESICSAAEGPQRSVQKLDSLRPPESRPRPCSPPKPVAVTMAQTDAISTCVSVGDDDASQAMVTVATSSADYAIDCATSDEQSQSEYLRPILVGYAFGPKKMSTMGIIMAEASKALSTVTMAAVPVMSSRDDAGRRRARQQQQQQQAAHEADGCDEDSHAGSCGKPPRLTTAALEHNAREGSAGAGAGAGTIDEDSSIASLYPPTLTLQHHDCDSQITVDESAGSSGIRFSIAGGPNGEGAGGIRNILRFFQSSCSSAASFAASSITTAATSAAQRPGSPSSSTVMSTKCFASIGPGGKNEKKKKKKLLQVVRVSFVPLDLDSPLEEQHGGKFDAILHKMTEDILLHASQSHNYDDDDELNDAQRQARQRVGRLEKYKRDHQACCLVDHPSYVQSVMSRADIAHILSKCLVGVTTRSGVPVGTPRFEVVGDNKDVNPSCGEVENLIDGAPFTYPIIVKPLPAAGTAASHRMVVVLNRRGLRRVQFPCLLQEYANHDGVLYKVYVLGDIVRVFPRNSLPNLPCGECFQHGGGQTGYVEFDSQRPYPKLSDFGVSLGQTKKGTACQEELNQSPFHKKRRISYTSSVGSQDKSPRKEQERIKGKLANAKLVTVDEIRPVACALRKAFGLELFGFDILITNRREVGETATQGDKEMLVVDVNYFPSYKEVVNFPSLLAQYLTQRAVEGRMSSVNSR